MGRAGVATGLSGSAIHLLNACSSPSKVTPSLPFTPLIPSLEDKLLLAGGFEYQILMKENDSLGNQKFGACNDFLAFIPLSSSKNEGLLWVNHEYCLPLFTSGFSKKSGKPKTKSQVEAERKSIGGSILHIKKANDSWSVMTGSSFNKRIDALTPIPFAAEKELLGSSTALGTLANCAGGVTPWNTVLTCEENYHHYYGEVSFPNGKRKVTPNTSSASWMGVDPQPPEHYGWVVEIDVKTGKSKKHTSMGRFAHEGATCVQAKDGRTVVYLGDDKDDECFYKFVTNRPGSLDEGTLYVAEFSKGQWIPLTLENDKLKKAFKNELDLKVRTREAAALVGGTKLDRPEDCEVDPKTGHIYLCCTNNKPAGRPYGAILKFEEKKGDFTSTEFKVSEFLPGGAQFACPDNLAFDNRGNLWMTCDMSEDLIGQEVYKKFGNNALYYIPLEGNQAGQVFQVASAPIGAEFTGPCFAPDGETLFLSVQHPGAGTKDLKNPLSRWPEYGNSLPKSSVVQITGKALRSLTDASRI